MHGGRKYNPLIWRKTKQLKFPTIAKLTIKVLIEFQDDPDKTTFKGFPVYPALYTIRIAL